MALKPEPASEGCPSWQTRLLDKAEVTPFRGKPLTQQPAKCRADGYQPVLVSKISKTAQPAFHSSTLNFSAAKSKALHRLFPGHMMLGLVGVPYGLPAWICFLQMSPNLQRILLLTVLWGAFSSTLSADETLVFNSTTPTNDLAGSLAAEVRFAQSQIVPASVREGD